MFIRLRQLFHRYAVQHLDAQHPGFPLFDEAGGKIGYLDGVRVAGGRLVAEGWAEAGRVALIVRNRRVEARPSLPRPDVMSAEETVGRADIGFLLDQPFEPAPAALCLETGRVRYVYMLPTTDAAAMRFRRWRLVPPFLLALVRSCPAIVRWKLSGDLAARAAVKAALGLADEIHSVGELSTGLFSGPAAQSPGPATPLTLILPIYNAFDLLPETLDRIVRHTDLPWRLIVVEDCSSDNRVRPFLRDWVASQETAAPGRITLIENPRNRGFIHSVNAALEIALRIGDHVVLLNSDAFVPAGWAARLIRPILTDPTVASVTPMSNDAEIFSVPVICQKSQLAKGLADTVDATARRFDPDLCLAEAPTGVGFCMAINVEYLKLEPRLDTEFGRGYGEEVDWCQRVRSRGGRHLGLAGLFVEHHGGMSFGSAGKQKQIAKNNAIISARYPRYDAEVQSFIRNDPLSGPRLALALTLEAARQARPIPIYLAHSLGGGAEKYLERRIARETAAGGSAVVLRVGGSQRWRLELHQAEGRISGRSRDFGLIESLLEPLTPRRIVYSCGVGDPDPVDLPDRLLSLRRSPADRIEVLFHDFFPLSPSYTLLNGKGVFAGLPDVGSTDPAHRTRRPDGRAVSLADWRAAWGRLMGAADEIVVFSADSGAYVRAAYPKAAAALVVRPHRMLAQVPRVTAAPKGRPVIGILGNIGYQKGAKVVVDLARALEQSGDAGLVLVGNIDPDYALPASAVLHGDYRISDIPALVARYGITAWLIPSIWPETFSFATHEALATGLPVMCFDLGAQAAAVRAAAQGQVIALSPGRNPAEAVLEHMTNIKSEAV